MKIANKLLRLFNIKGLAFYGTQKDLQDYENGIGNATASESNIRSIVSAFEKDSEMKQKNYMICKIDKPYSIALLHNENNKYDSYMMIYNYLTDFRVYSVNISDIPTTANSDRVAYIARNTPRMCSFYETKLNKKESKEIWMLDDLQRFADAVDEYNIDYE